MQPLLPVVAGDSIFASLTLASSSIEAADGDDSISLSVLSGSTIYAGSGADSIILPKVNLLRFIQIRETISSPLRVMQPPPLSLVVKDLIPSVLVAMSPAAKSLVIPVLTASPLTGTVNSALVHGGAGNDSMTVGAIVGGTAGGGLGADTLVVSGKVTGAEVLMSSKSDPNSSSDGADSLTVNSSMSNSTVYAGAGADTISVDSATWWLVNCLLAVVLTRSSLVVPWVVLLLVRWS